MSRSPSPSRSPSSSRSSSRSRSERGSASETSPARNGGDIGAAGNRTTAGLAVDRSLASSSVVTSEAVDEIALLIQYALRGDSLSVRRALTHAASSGRSAGLLSHIYSRKAKKKGGTVKGTLLFFAAYCGHEAVVRAIEDADAHGYRANCWPAFCALVAKYNFDGALLLLPAVVAVVSSSTSASFPLTVSRSTGDNVLHRAMRVGKAPTAFIKAVLAARRKLQLNVNARNAQGLTALHLGATHGYGAEGRDAVRMLLAAGADEFLTTPDGAVAKDLAVNGYVREVLGVAIPGKPRHIPEIDAAAKEAIDGCADSSQFPPLPEIKDPLPEPSTTAAPGNDDSRADDEDEEAGAEGGAGKQRPLNLRTKVITQEDLDAMLGRLYDRSIAKQKKDYAEALAKIEEADKARYHSKSLGGEELEASVLRLCNQEMEGRLERNTALCEKYMPPPEPPKKLEMADMEESNQRLCKASVDSLAETRRELTAKYSPPRKSHKLTKDEVTSCALRLHDECTEKSRKEMAELFEQYAVIKKGRFNGERKMTADEIKAMGDRLCKAK